MQSIFNKNSSDNSKKESSENKQENISQKDANSNTEKNNVPKSGEKPKNDNKPNENNKSEPKKEDLNKKADSSQQKTPNSNVNYQDLSKEKLIDKINELEVKLKDFEIGLEKVSQRYKEIIIEKSKKASEEIKRQVNENYEKTTKEIARIKKYAIKDYAVSLITVINQFEFVVNSPQDNEAIKNYLQGFKMILSMFENLLSEMGIKKIKIKPGDEFDEKLMEGIELVSDQKFSKNKVVKIIKDGYILHDDMVIIHAQVVVSK